MNTQFCWEAYRWIERQSELSRQRINHALCGHEGETCVVIDKNEILVDGFNPEISTVYQLYGCKWKPPMTGQSAGIVERWLSETKSEV